MWDGWNERELRPEYANQKIVLREWAIKRSEIHAYLTPDFYAAYNLWAMIKRYGWPHGPDWINEPAGLVDMVALFDAELELLKEKERHKNADT